MGLIRNFRQIQQDLTELNGDGNRTRGRYGEDDSEKRGEEDDEEDEVEEAELDQGC